MSERIEPAAHGGGRDGEVVLDGVTKAFGATLAVDDLSLTVHAGEFISLLGPSGCGKTTTLLMIAGTGRPDRRDDGGADLRRGRAGLRGLQCVRGQQPEGVLGLARTGTMDLVPLDLSPERFDALVEAALDEIPDELAARVHNVVVLVEDEPPEGEPSDLLGLYDGVALTEQSLQDGGRLPDRILVFRRPLLAWCASEEELVEEVRITVVHEIAHHFGIDDDRLHDLGYA